MNKRFLQLLEQMTPEEQAEVESFAAFVLARREIGKLQVLTDDIPPEELTKLVEDSGGFDWLRADSEDVYSIKDGEPVKWGKET